MHHCLNCDTYTDFSELNRSLDSDDDAGDPGHFRMTRGRNPRVRVSGWILS